MAKRLKAGRKRCWWQPDLMVFVNSNHVILPVSKSQTLNSDLSEGKIRKTSWRWRWEHNIDEDLKLKLFSAVILSAFLPLLWCNLWCEGLLVLEAIVPTALTGGHGLSAGERWSNLFGTRRWPTQTIKVIDQLENQLRENVHAIFFYGPVAGNRL